MTERVRRNLNEERGSVMLVVACILIALLAGGGIALYVTVQGTKATGFLKANRSALYCAEAGLSAARAKLAEDPTKWNTLLDGDAANDPGWYPITGDLDGDGDADYEVTVRDNDDELPPAANDPTHDSDLGILIVSRCTKYPETPRQVFELVFYELGDSAYRDQSGQGAGNTGNAN